MLKRVLGYAFVATVIGVVAALLYYFYWLLFIVGGVAVFVFISNSNPTPTHTDFSPTNPDNRDYVERRVMASRSNSDSAPFRAFRVGSMRH